MRTQPTMEEEAAAIASSSPASSSLGINNEPENVAMWEECVRQGLLSDDTRERLRAYMLLSTKCGESKQAQNSVGALVRNHISTTDIDPSATSSPQRLLDIISQDLQASDRTVRLAAARLLCNVTYENFLTQDAVMQLCNGFSVGWMYVFSIPQVLQRDYEIQCKEMKSSATTKDFKTYLQRIVMENYGPIYHRVSSYYSSGCRCFVPLSWYWPQRADCANMSVEEIDHDVPDPAEHLIGFYLVPRQVQFPEQDEFYTKEILQSIDSDDLKVLDQVHEVLAEMSTKSNERESFLSISKEQLWNALIKQPHMKWLLNDEDEQIVRSKDSSVEIGSLLNYFSGERSQSGTVNKMVCSVSWNQVLTYCCMQLNAKKFKSMFGDDTYQTVSVIFHQLAMDQSFPSAKSQMKRITSERYVWETAFVGAILQHSTLPRELKQHVKQFHNGLYMRANGLRGLFSSLSELMEQPWLLSFPLQLDQLYPLSWCHFLTQWRIVSKNLAIEQSLQHHSPVVCSVAEMRKSIVEIKPHSFTDLEKLRSRLPSLFRSHENQISNIDSSSSVWDLEEDIAERHIHQMAVIGKEEWDQEEDPLDATFALFHKIQRSNPALNQISLERMQEKQTSRSKVFQTVAINKKKVEAEDDRKHCELLQRCREKEEKLDELRKKQLRHRQTFHQKQRLRHERALRRKHQQDIDEVAKRLELKAHIDLQQMEGQKIREANKCGTYPKRELHGPPSQPPPTRRRPQSARTSSTSAASTQPSTISPEIVRYRAQIYGNVVSKIYLAEAAKRPPLPSSATSRSTPRRFSTFHMQNFKAKLAYSHSNEQIQETNEEKSDEIVQEESKEKSVRQHPLDPIATAEAMNACTTLVMRNAALAVSERISIPDVLPPRLDEPNVPPFVIAAQYAALTDEQKSKFRERFDLTRVSHRLTFAVLKQFTKFVRRDLAWEEFHELAARTNGGRPCGKLKYADFMELAQRLGIQMLPKKLLAVARELDENKAGFVHWKMFYTWWSMQYDDHLQSSRT